MGERMRILVDIEKLMGSSETALLNAVAQVLNLDMFVQRRDMEA